MFCIQRKLRVRDEHPDWPNWLASADYLITATIIISVLLVILPLVVFPALGTLGFSIAAASCAAASILLLAYPFAILDHYRTELGIWRTRKAKARACRAHHRGVGWSDRDGDFRRDHMDLAS